MVALLMLLGCARPDASSGVELTEAQRPEQAAQDTGGDSPPVDSRPGPEDSAPATGIDREGGLCDGEVVVARLGLGQSGYLPMPEGARLRLWHGPAGGWNFILALNTFNADEINTLTLRAVDVETGIEVCVGGPLTARLVRENACEKRYWNLYCYTSSDDLLALSEHEACDWAPELLAHREVEVQLEVLGYTSGREARDAARAVVSLDPYDAAHFSDDPDEYGYWTGCLE